MPTNGNTNEKAAEKQMGKKNNGKNNRKNNGKHIYKTTEKQWKSNAKAMQKQWKSNGKALEWISAPKGGMSWAQPWAQGSPDQGCPEGLGGAPHEGLGPLGFIRRAQILTRGLDL